MGCQLPWSNPFWWGSSRGTAPARLRLRVNISWHSTVRQQSLNSLNFVQTSRSRRLRSTSKAELWFIKAKSQGSSESNGRISILRSLRILLREQQLRRCFRKQMRAWPKIRRLKFLSSLRSSQSQTAKSKKRKKRQRWTKPWPAWPKKKTCPKSASWVTLSHQNRLYRRCSVNRSYRRVWSSNRSRLLHQNQ